MGGVSKKEPNLLKSIKNKMKTIGFKIEHAKSMGGVEKVTKLVAKTDGFLMWSLTTLQVWTPEATMSLHFAYEMSEPTQGEHRTYTRHTH